MKKLLFLLLISCFSAFSAFSQSYDYDDDYSLQKKWFFGGGLGMQFGSYTFIDVSPYVGYRVTPMFNVGLGMSYMYQKVNDNYYGYNYESNILGARVFARYLIAYGLFAHVEYEHLSQKLPEQYYPGEGRIEMDHIFVGGGYRQYIGGSAFASITVLYNLTETAYTPYSNPIFRVGFGVGF